jgi:PAS domain S-box-containing protein
MTYELLAGRVPFVGDPISVLMQQVNKEPPSLAEQNLSIAPEVANVVARALRKDPEARYSSCGAFAAALLEVVGAVSPSIPSAAATLPTIDLNLATPPILEPATVMMNMEGKVTGFNAAAEQMLGMLAQDAIGRAYTDVFGPSLADRVVSLFMRVARSRTAAAPQLVEATLPNGRRASFRADLAPILDDTGELCGVRLTVADPPVYLMGGETAPMESA